MQQYQIPSLYNVIKYETIGSTNAEAARLAALGEEVAPDGTLVWALEQTEGRGRRGRNWQSPTGNLYTSLILRPEVPLGQAAQLGFVAALAVYDALGNIAPAGHQVHCKWPNDILLNEKKVAGILLESQGGGAEQPAEWLILGMGLNIDSHPQDTDFPATCLRYEGFECSLDEVLSAYTKSFLSWTNRWLDRGFEPIRKDWQWRSIGRGEEIDVRLETQTLSGVFEDIDEDGALLLNRGGKIQRITAGDVFFPGSAG
ncbi:MAG: biotin--[acetyl-CoA-carboxylase] ligase [Rhodospirillales bacterium]|nr:biotin--[acetyl-CoA-carboxylase] ligase [Rhodospirillales bacterium]